MDCSESRDQLDTVQEISGYLTPGPPKRAKTVGDWDGSGILRREGNGDSTEGRAYSTDEEEGEGEGSEEEEDVVTQVDKFFADLDMDYHRQRKRLLSDPRVKTSRRRSVLPSHLHTVMGGANLRLARGELAEAIKLCMEVIRQAPESPEPYLTLATAYEDQGDRRKLLQIVLIAAHLKRVDADLWTKTADLAVEHGQLSLGLQCYSKASRMEPANLAYIWRKAELYDQLGDDKKALDTYEQLMKSLVPDSGEMYVTIAKEMARLYHKVGETEKAVDLLRGVLQYYPSNVDNEGINLHAELCLAQRLYLEAFQVITGFYSMIPISPEGTSSGQEQGASHDLLATPPQRLVAEQTGGLFSPPFSLSEALRLTMSSEEEGEEEGGGSQKQAHVHSSGFSLRLTLSSEEEGEEEGRGNRKPAPVHSSGFSLSVPEEMPVDLRAKLAICLVYMGRPLPEDLISPIFPHPEEYGDLFLDIADAYSDNGEYSNALPLLSALIHTHKYSQAGVWLKHAECLHMMGDLEAAAMSYAMVVSLAPNHTETRITLATLYTQLGLVDDALAMLEEPREEGGRESMEEEEEGGVVEVVKPRRRKSHKATPTRDSTAVAKAFPPFKERQIEDIRLLLHKYTLLVNEGRRNEYVAAGVELLAFYFREIYSIRDVRSIMHLSLRKIHVKLREWERGAGGGEEAEKEKETVVVKRALKEQESLLKVEEWWKVFFTTCRGLYQIGHPHYRQLAHLIYCAKALKKFDVPTLEMTFALFAVSALRLVGEESLQSMFLKQVCYKNLEANLPWSILNSLPVYEKTQKFVLRLCFKNPTNTLLMRVCANFSLASSSYKLALGQYEMAYRHSPSDHLLCLCISISYLNLASQNKILHRNALVTQALGFLHKYVRLRGHCQETMYNIGRLFHQLGVMHVACHFYKQVLRMEPESRLPQWSSASDLRREAAFNLSLIYRASGNKPLALHILRQYCTI